MNHMKKQYIPSPIIMTRQGFEQFVQEQKDLQSKRPHAVSELAKARAMGDLSENGYYKAARFQLNGIDHRLRQLKHMLRYAKVLESTNKDIVQIGCTVVISTGEGEKTYALVGSHESNPEEGKLSHLSPIGKALMGKKVDEIITITTPRGIISYKIVSIG